MDTHAMADSNVLSIESLTVENARAVLEQGCAAIRAGQTVFDLGAVKVADSSAVAVLLAWERMAFKAGVALTYRHLPPSVQSLSTLYGVDAFLVDSPAAQHQL
jgi:phospholipid transport system transporter-binding protein